MSRQRGAGRGGDRRAARRALPARLAAGRRRPLDRCRPRGATPSPRSATAPRRVFLALGRQELAPLRQRAAALLPRAQRRPGRAAARCSRAPLHPRRAARSPRPTSATLLAEHRIDVVRRQEQRRRRRPTPRSRRRATLGLEVVLVRRPPRDRRRDRRDRRWRRWRWLDHRLPPADEARRVDQRRPFAALDDARLGRADDDAGRHVGACRVGLAERHALDALVGPAGGAAEDHRRRGRQIVAQASRRPGRAARAAPC